MTDLEKKSKKELVDIIQQLRDKLSDMQVVEEKQDALETNLSGIGFSIVQDEDEKFKLLEISFDFATKAAKITKVEDIHPSNYEFSLFQAKKFLIDRVMDKVNLNHLKEKKNG
jgi:hypothetical protein